MSNCLYFGLILVWATPVITFLWYCGADALIANGIKLKKIIFLSTIYLCISDHWSIHHDVWHINERYILPLKSMIPPGPLQEWMGPFGTEQLPFEECFFFLVTSILCTFGLHLMMSLSVSWKINLAATFTSVSCPLIFRDVTWLDINFSQGRGGGNIQHSS